MTFWILSLVSREAVDGAGSRALSRLSNVQVGDHAVVEGSSPVGWCTNLWFVTLGWVDFRR